MLNNIHLDLSNFRNKLSLLSTVEKYTRNGKFMAWEEGMEWGLGTASLFERTSLLLKW
jgi:hypothetical protein